jgi:integrase
MGLHTLLHRRGAVYYFRQRIPNTLQPILGKAELRLSLGTSDAREAIKRLRILSAQIARQFEAVQLGIQSKIELDSNNQNKAQNSMSAAQGKTTNNMKLDTLLAEWVEEQARSQKPISHSTHSEWKLSVRQFKEVNGDIPVDAITKEHIRKYKAALSKLPKHLKPAMRIRPLPEVLKLVSDGDLKGEGLAASTIRKRLVALSTLFNFAVNNDYITSNPVSNMLPPKASHNQLQPRLDYSKADIKCLINSPIYTGCHPYYRATKGDVVIKDSRYWIPLLGLFTGAREEELCQLLASDIKYDDEHHIHYISFGIGDEKTFKAGVSIRKTPLHNELLKAGFIDYVNQIRAQKEMTLFPDAVRGSKGRYTAIFSKRYNRYIDAIGIDEKGKDFHSLRHTIKTALRRAKVEEQYIDAIVGHENKSVGRGYGSYPPDVLNAEIQKIQYGVDFSHLHVDTKYPLNPFSANQQAETPTVMPKAKIKATAKDLLSAVSLGEAFNQLGRCTRGKQWVDYQICYMENGKWLKKNLTPMSCPPIIGPRNKLGFRG